MKPLAIFTENPAFAEPLHVGRPNVVDAGLLQKSIEDILQRKWLTNNGPYVQSFEKKIAEHVGVKHCIAMCNGTVALEILIRAAELTGEVIIPSFTFIATAHALQWQEIQPVFCDINPVTHSIDPDQIESLITEKTTAIIGVHLWGRPCEIEKLQAIAKKHQLKLLFDAAHAFGASHHQKMIGGFGLAEIFSFHATKFISTGEGGAVVTNDDDLAKKIRLMQNFGFEGEDNVIYIGTNGKMDEISSAVGLLAFENAEEIIKVNHVNYQDYQHYLSDVPGVSLICYDTSEKNNYQYIVLEIDSCLCGLTRDELRTVLIAENILARRYFYPGCHRMEPYRSIKKHSNLTLPHTSVIANQVLVLPTGTSVNQEDICAICQIITSAIKNSKEVSLQVQTNNP